MKLSYEMRSVKLTSVRSLFKRFHPYKSIGNNATYAWAVFEDDKPIAAYVWQPPPPGAARHVCPEAPQGVLSLSRMVAVPRSERKLNHVSKPLRRQMKLIDRTRWPVLITYSDEGEGHTGHVYKCSGWTKTTRSKRPVWKDKKGARVSSYANGKHQTSHLVRSGTTFVQRWEHWVCEKGDTDRFMREHGWRRIAMPGRKWRSGNSAFTYVKES